ncbi:MAG: GTPase [Candidatus Lokiarchaeia archaeon]|nr:GTPase [Candidatus Lokiarchaeia archaeon]
MTKKPSLLIIGNSNVGKSSITKLLMPNPRNFKGKIGKIPGSTLLIKSYTQKNLPYIIVDLPGFGYVGQSSRRRGEHIKKQIVIHIEKHFNDYFFGLIIINILRIEDEIQKYFIQNKNTIPLSFELIQFLREFKIPLLILFNKIDKVSNLDKKELINIFIESAKDYGLNLISLNEYLPKKTLKIPYLEFSALKKINIGKLKDIINEILHNSAK